MSGTLSDLQLVRVLRALADAKRFRMVQQIALAGELTCGQVAERFSLSQPTISHHLKLLSDAGIVRIRHAAKHRYISVDHTLLAQVVGEIPVRIAEPPYKRTLRRELARGPGRARAAGSRSTSRTARTRVRRR